MASEARDNPVCPVLFFGTPTLSAGFDAFAEAAEKSKSIQAKRFLKLDQAPEALKEIDHGVVFFLLSGKNDLLTILNYLPALKKRVDQGVVRAMVFSMLEHDKIPNLLKSKGCSETLSGTLSQKALGHKLQKSVQIVMAKFQTIKKDKIDDIVALKGNNPRGKAQGNDDVADLDFSTGSLGGKAGAAEKRAAVSQKGQIEFGPPLENENDCWLLKTKKDFKFVRGFWMGELIGPGPSAGTWEESKGPRGKGEASFEWTPRNAGADPFVPGGGKWIFFGRKPEFIWKTNRWRFIGEIPSLYYLGDASSTLKLYRFCSPSAGLLELSLNSSAAKGKLNAILQTITVDKVFKEEKKSEGMSNDLELGADEEAGGSWNDKVSKDDEEAADWNDEVGEDLDPEVDWGGLDTGRGNKFSGGRGMGQGEGDGNKGYKHEDQVFENKEKSGVAWKKGAEAFDKIKLEVSMIRASGGSIPGVTLLERNENDLILDAPSGDYVIGERLDFDVLVAKSGKSKSLKVGGVLVSTEPMEDGSRDMIQIKVDEASVFQLSEIQKVFEQRQEQLLSFLREAKGG